MERCSHTLNRTRFCSQQGSLGIPRHKHLVPAVSPRLAVSVTLPKVLQSLVWGASAGTRGQHHPSPLRRSVWREVPQGSYGLLPSL